MKIYLTSIVLVCMLILGCKTKQAVTQERPLTGQDYLVTLNAGYSDVDIRAIMGNNAERILPSSKTQSLFLLRTTGNQQDIDEKIEKLRKSSITAHVTDSTTIPDPPQNSTNSDMKKSTPILDN